MRRIILSLALVAVIVLASVAATCSKQTFISNARAAAASYRDAEPFFRELGLPTTRLTQAIGLADDLVSAFEANQNERAVDIIAALISRTNQIIAEDVALIKDEAKRVKVMAVLAIGNIALHWISANLVKQVEASPMTKGAVRAAAVMSGERARAIQTIRDFAAAPAWGAAYVR